MNKLSRIMILKNGCFAKHQIGDIQACGDEFIYVSEEYDDHYIGHFIEGFGLIGLVYNKSDVRYLTQEEIDRFSNLWFTINGSICWRSTLDEEGNVIKTENNVK